MGEIDDKVPGVNQYGVPGRISKGIHGGISEEVPEEFPEKFPENRISLMQKKKSEEYQKELLEESVKAFLGAVQRDLLETTNGAPEGIYPRYPRKISRANPRRNRWENEFGISEDVSR